MASKCACAPGTRKNYKSKKSPTCIPKQDLRQLYNRYSKDIKRTIDENNENNQITSSSKKITKKDIQTSKQLWQILHDYFRQKHGIERESSWTKFNDKLKKYFRPQKPDDWTNNPTEWLSNFDIADVLQQYENVRSPPPFKLISVSPIDWNTQLPSRGNKCVSQSICNLDVPKLRQFVNAKVYNLAMVFNTDKHNQSGSHWISFFIHLNPRNKKFGIHFFDSNGNNMPRPVARLANQLQERIEELTGKKPPIRVNKKEFQKTNTECGMFCIYFVLEMSKRGTTFDSIIKRKLTDNQMINLRSQFFLNPEKS
jgi:hypothetical protein